MGSGDGSPVTRVQRFRRGNNSTENIQQGVSLMEMNDDWTYSFGDIREALLAAHVLTSVLSFLRFRTLIQLS
jgi:hypothetical protein